MDTEKLFKEQYARLRYDCAQNTKELAHCLSVHFNAHYVLKPPFEMRLRLMIWRALCVKHQLSMMECVNLTLDYMERRQPRTFIPPHMRLANVLPIALSNLIGPRVWNACTAAVEETYPRQEQKQIRASEQLLQFTSVAKPLGDYSTVQEYADAYRQHIAVSRKISYRSSKPFRNSPWSVV